VNIRNSRGGIVMGELQEILIQKRKELNLSLREAGNLIGISHSYLSTLEKGVDPRTGAPIKPTPETLKLISKAYGINYHILMKAAGYLDETNIPNIEMLHKAGLREVGEMVSIPIIGSVKAGKDGIIAFEDYLGEEKVEKEAVKDGERYFLLRVKGDSMYPEMKEGDLVLVRQQSDVDSGDYAVVIINGGEGIVKRLIKKGNAVVLQSVNPLYEPIIITPDMEFIIAGKVKRVIRIY
jgi:SOS-response transcriptional repressor LexA